MTNRGRRSRPGFGDVREAASGLKPWALIRAATSPALGLPSAERIVLVALARHADAFGYCWPSLRRLAHCAGLGERRTWQAVKTLEGKGLIAVEKVNGRVNTYRIEAAAIEKLADSETAARSARVNAGENPQKATTVEHAAEVTAAPPPFTAGAERENVENSAPTLARGARTLARGARTLARDARTLARGASEVAANGNRLIEEGCAAAHHAPTTREHDEAERALAEAERSLPEWCRTSVQLAKVAYQRGQDPKLLMAMLQRLQAEVAAAGGA